MGALALVLCATGVEARGFSLSNVTSESNLESFSLWCNCDPNADRSAILDESNENENFFLSFWKKTTAGAQFRIFSFFLNFARGLLEFASNGCGGLISTFFRIFFVHI